MTALGEKMTTSNRVVKASIERIPIPSALDASDCVAAWDFYTLYDGTGGGSDLTLGPKVNRLDAGGIVIGDTGTSSYATCNGLALPSQFSFVCSVKWGASMGTIFGNYANPGVETGLRVYSASGSIVAKIGDDTGRASLTTSLADWMEIGVAFNGSTITICTLTDSVTGSEGSALGSEACRFGRSISGTAPAAGGATIACAALYNTARTISSLRELMAIAQAQRIDDGWV